MSLRHYRRSVWRSSILSESPQQFDSTSFFCQAQSCRIAVLHCVRFRSVSDVVLRQLAPVDFTPEWTSCKQFIIRIASLLDLGTQRTPRNTFQTIRVISVMWLSINCLYGAIVNMQPLVEPPSISAASSRISVHTQRKIVPRQVSGKRMDGQVCFIQFDVGHKLVCFFDHFERWF